MENMIAQMHGYESTEDPNVISIRQRINVAAKARQLTYFVSNLVPAPTQIVFPH